MGNCCKVYFIVDGLSEDMNNNDHGEYVCSDDPMTGVFSTEVLSWDCVGAEAKFCTEKHCNGGEAYYSGYSSTNNDTTGLGIKWVEVSEPDYDWFVSKWTVFEKDNCEGRSALLPIYEGEYADWRDYAET